MKTFCVAMLLASGLGLVMAQSASAANEIHGRVIMHGRVIHHPVHGRIVHPRHRGRMIRHPHHPIHGRIVRNGHY